MRARVAVSALTAALCALLVVVGADADDPARPCAGDARWRIVAAPGEDGMGGSGLRGGDEDGMGGTGLRGEGDPGMGGTGLLADRVGVVGTVTGFGSICVNGLRVAYDEDTLLVADGEPATPEHLAVGSVVSLEAKPDDGGLHAERVAVHTALAGPITRVDTDGERLFVMGQEVRVASPGVVEGLADGKTPLVGLRVGRSVTVSGMHRGDGVLIASRLASRPSQARAIATGPVRRRADGTLTVGGVRVAGPGPYDGERIGFARVSGRWNQRDEVLETPRIEPVGGFGTAVERVSVEGFVLELPSGTLTIRGLVVDDSAWGRGLPGGGGPVVVEGVLSEERALIAERVWIRAGGHSPDAPGAGTTLPSQAGGAERARESLELPERPGSSERPARPGRSPAPQRPDTFERPRPAGPPDRPGR